MMKVRIRTKALARMHAHDKNNRFMHLPQNYEGTFHRDDGTHVWIWVHAQNVHGRRQTHYTRLISVRKDNIVTLDVLDEVAA